MTNPYARVGSGAAPSSNPYARVGSSGGVGKKKPKGRGLLGSVARYSGAEFVGNLAQDVGETAVGIVPGLVRVGDAINEDIGRAVKHPLRESSIYQTITGGNAPRSTTQEEILEPIIQGYKDYYGSGNLLHNLYEHPLQPILDLATVATGGAAATAKVGAAAAKAGRISETSGLARLGQRTTITTRSPRAAATGKGPVHTELTSTAPLVKGREVLAGKTRSGRPEGTLGVGGEMKRYGKQIQAQATQSALGRMLAHEPYQKVTKRVSPDEWEALHIRAMDIHPDDLAELWNGRTASISPKVRALVLTPSKRMRQAEPEMRSLSAQGAELYKQRGRLTEATAAARPDLTKRQAAEVLGRPVRSVTGNPYYFPHTIGPQRAVSPLAAAGGGKGVPRKLGSMRQNTGVLALTGKIHLRGDVLGPEFLRRVKYVKYDEVHNALVRGAIRVTRDDLNRMSGGQLPKGYEYIRAYAGQKIPPTLRGESDQAVTLQRMIPDPEDLHESVLAREGLSTTDIAQAHQSGGRYYIVPKQTVKAATGEFTRSSDFTRNFVKRPLTVWRSIVLGLRVGFLTNNLVGNSIMYAAKTGGQGALRDLFMAIKETHGDDVARKALDNAATPPKLRADLYKEFFPEQVRGTFGRTQSPSTSPGHVAAGKALEAGRAVTGAIPKVTSKVAEEIPRRALIRHYIRHSPEFKQVYTQLPKQTRTFEQAARKLLEGKEGKQYQAYISKRVNQALGDYLGLSPTERNIVRNTIPFYAWYKAITTTTFHLAVDTPLRANILGQIGRIGKDASDEALGEVPSYLQGAIPLGEGPGGTKRVLGTQGLNPYGTLDQLRRGSLEDFSSLGLNPFIQGPLQQVQRGEVSPGAIASGALTELVRGLPPSRVAFPKKPSKIYPNRGRRLEALGYLGATVKEYDPIVAAMQARQGR